MADMEKEQSVPGENTPARDRRSFIKGTAAGILGAVGVTGGLSQNAEAQQAPMEDPKAPEKLGRTGIPDMRYPVCFEHGVPEAFRVLSEYFAALSRRDLKGMAESLHFPFGSYEGTQVVVVNSPDELLAHAPASMNMTEAPERFTDHDGYLKPGAYDTFDGIQYFNSDPVRVNMAMSYNRYDKTGKKILRCDGIYCVTNNDGKWGITLMSTIFTPADLIGMVYNDTVMAAKRLRINHDLAYQVEENDGVWGRVRQYGKGAGVGGGGGGGTPWQNAGKGTVMRNFRFVGVKNRLGVNNTTPESLARVHIDFPETLRTVAAEGVGNWGFPVGILPATRVVHHTVDKAHLYSGVTRYNTAGEEISDNMELSVVTYVHGRWGWSGTMGYITNHDRANDVT